MQCTSWEDRRPVHRPVGVTPKEGERMDEVSAEAKLASEGVSPSLTVAVPRLQVQRAVDEELEADLTLDVVRTNGQREERRVLVALDGEALRQLLAEGDGEQVMIAVDPEPVAATFDGVDAHGMREIGATFAIAIAAVGGGAGIAAAAADEGGAQTVQAVVSPYASGDYMPSADVADSIVSPYASGDYMPSVDAADAVVSPYASGDYMPSVDVSDVTPPEIEQVRGSQVREAPADIEQVRAAEPAPEPGPLPSGHIAATPAPDTSHDAIENVRVGAPATPDPMSAIEDVRADRTPVEVGDGGTTIAAPSTGAAVAIAGGAMLTLAAAAFALRRRREPGLA